MSRRRSKRIPEKPPPPPNIEIEKVTVGSLWSGAGRLTIGSVVFLFGIVSAIAASGFAAGEWHGRTELQTALEQQTGESVELRNERDKAQSELSYLRSSSEKFAKDFATRALDPEVIELLRLHIAQQQIDGFDDEKWLLASLVWQLKAQNGFAEFLFGEEALRLELQFDEGGDIEFQWDEGRNAVTDILALNQVEFDAGMLSGINESLNRYGFYPLAHGKLIVRGVDGGILLARPGY